MYNIRLGLFFECIDCYYLQRTFICLIAVPPQPPTNVSLTPNTSTDIEASWQLPTEDSRNGIILGFKLFYKKKDSLGTQAVEHINSSSARTKVVSGLAKYTEYEFQVLAYTSVGDGPKSSVKYERTKEDGKKLKKVRSKFDKLSPLDLHKSLMVLLAGYGNTN